MAERAKSRRLVALIPNMFTLASLCAGMTAIRYAVDERWPTAVGLIAFAVLLDGLDGRSARMLKLTSKLGAQLDSLADFVSFGVAPAMIVYLWALNDVRAIGWALALLFATCMALRLARFNVQEEEGERPSWMRDFFSGVPAPAAGGLVLLPLLLSLGLENDWPQIWPLNAALMAFTSLMMVAPIPTFSIKRIQIGPDMIAPTLIAFGMFVAFLVVTPWLALAAIGLIYLASIPFAIRKAQRLKREAT